MSVVQNPLIGATKQSMGNATFSTWKGIYVLKTKPLSVANPNTDGQKRQRSAFTTLVKAFREMPSAIRTGFKELADKKSEFNAFLSYNIKNAFDFTGVDTATLVPANLLISRGTIASTPLLTAVADKSADTIVVTWAAGQLQPGQSVSDVAIVGSYNATLNEFFGVVTTALRSAGTATINLPDNWVAGNAIHTYLGFYSPIGRKASDSTHLAGTLVP